MELRPSRISAAPLLFCGALCEIRVGASGTHSALVLGKQLSGFAIKSCYGKKSKKARHRSVKKSEVFSFCFCRYTVLNGGRILHLTNTSQGESGYYKCAAADPLSTLSHYISSINAISLQLHPDTSGESPFLWLSYRDKLGRTCWVGCKSFWVDFR